MLATLKLTEFESYKTIIYDGLTEEWYMPYNNKKVEQESHRSGKLAYKYTQHTAKYRENFSVATEALVCLVRI